MQILCSYILVMCPACAAFISPRHNSLSFHPPWTGADPGFLVGGGTDPLWGLPTYDFVEFSQKLHEIEKILGCGGHAPGAPSWIRH